MSTSILWSVRSLFLVFIHLFIRRSSILVVGRHRQACHVMISDSFIFEVSPLRIILCMIVFFLVRLRFAQIKASQAPVKTCYSLSHTHTHLHFLSLLYLLIDMYSTHYSIHFRTGLVRSSNDIDLFGDDFSASEMFSGTRVLSVRSQQRERERERERDLEVGVEEKSSAYDIISDWLRVDKK